MQFGVYDSYTPNCFYKYPNIMCKNSISSENTRYVFHYEVETNLWKNPFNKSVTDEDEYIKERSRNAYHDLKKFIHEDPLEARKKAFNYLRSMLDVLCESIGKPYCNYWQAVRDLQPMFRADHPLAHQRVGIIQFDDDLLCGVSLTLMVEKGGKHDRVSIFNLGVYDDDRKEEILSDVVYSIVELERERRYYQLARVPIETVTVDLSDVGLDNIEIIPGIIDLKDFNETFNGTNVLEAIDSSPVYDRQCEILIN